MSEERQERVILYVLDLLDEGQRRDFEREMETDAWLRSEVCRWHDTLGSLARGVVQVEPPAALRERVLESVAGMPQEGEAKDRTIAFPLRQPVLWLAAAAVLVLGGVATWLWLRAPDAGSQAPAVTEVKPVEVPMEGQIEGYGEVKARVAWDPKSRSGTIKAEALPALPEEQTYQIWILDPRHPEPLSAGIFDHPQTGPATVSYRTEAVTGDTVRIAVSIEPSGGSAQPTGPVVLVSAEAGG